MYSSQPSDNHDATRLTVADILSTMASTVDAMTPTTLSLLDGLTGVPTRTTPTLTPTTLRNIEQTFMDLAANQISHEREAGFVPPLVSASTHSSVSSSSNYTVTVTTSTQQQGTAQVVDVKPWVAASVSQNNSPLTTLTAAARNTTQRMSVGSNSDSSDSSYSSTAASCTSNRRSGGRRKDDRDDIVGEDADKRLMRRERNKQAAARCRKRRLDHTMALQQEVDLWEDKKQHLQNEIRQLQKEKEELDVLLESHQSQCKMRKVSSSYKAGLMPPMPNLTPISSNHIVIKEECLESNDSFSSENEMNSTSQLDPLACSPPLDRRIEFTRPGPRPRPTSLPFASSPFTNVVTSRSSANWNEIAGIAITTPSSGIPGFNFDSLMEGGTGLTPVVPSPSCGTQQQRSAVLPVDLSSPEAVNRKLVSL